MLLVSENVYDARCRSVCADTGLPIISVMPVKAGGHFTAGR